MRYLLLFFGLRKIFLATRCVRVSIFVYSSFMRNQKSIVILENKTSLLYERKVFQCLCDTGSVAVIINAFEFPF